eukprot:UN3518
MHWPWTKELAHHVQGSIGMCPVCDRWRPLNDDLQGQARRTLARTAPPWSSAAPMWSLFPHEAVHLPPSLALVKHHHLCVSIFKQGRAPSISCHHCPRAVRRNRARAGFWIHASRC